jgi:hypothetical protein
VEAVVADPQGGNNKRRPLLVVGFEDDGRVVWCAISSTFPVPIPHTCIRLPSDPRGHPSTGLTVECVAVCEWVDSFDVSEIECKRGYVSTKTLRRVVQIIEDLAEEE